MVFFDCFPLILHVLTSLVKRILWLKFFHRQNVGRGQEGGRTRGTCSISPWSTFVEVYHFLQCYCHHITFSNNSWNWLSIPDDVHFIIMCIVSDLCWYILHSTVCVFQFYSSLVVIFFKYCFSTVPSILLEILLNVGESFSISFPCFLINCSFKKIFISLILCTISRQNYCLPMQNNHSSTVSSLEFILSSSLTIHPPHPHRHSPP